MAIICLSYIGATLHRILFFAVVGSRCVCRILPDLSCLDKRRMWNQDCLPKLSPRHPAALQMVSMVTFSTQASAAGSLLSFLSHFPSLSKSARQGAKISISLGWESIMAFTVETSWQWRHFPRYENASPFWGGFHRYKRGLVRFWLKGTFPIDVDVTNDSHKWDVWTNLQLHTSFRKDGNQRVDGFRCQLCLKAKSLMSGDPENSYRVNSDVSCKWGVRVCVYMI